MLIKGARAAPIIAPLPAGVGSMGSICPLCPLFGFVLGNQGSKTGPSHDTANSAADWGRWMAEHHALAALAG